jgi:hypothetical protein
MFQKIGTPPLFCYMLLPFDIFLTLLYAYPSEVVR